MKKSFVLLTSLLSISALFSCTNKDNVDYLTFTALEDNSILMCTHSREYKESELPKLFVSKDKKNWEKITINNETNVNQTPYAKLNKGESVYLSGSNPFGISKSEKEFIHFSCIDDSGQDLRFTSSGNIMTLISPKGNLKEIPCDYCFTYMFASTDYDACRLVNAPKLPATSLTKQCYSYMFFDDVDLETASELPSYDIKEKCYAYMFAQCKSLKAAPKLISHKTAPYCYDHMFYGNSSLSSIEINITDWDREGDFPCCFWVSFDGEYPMSKKGTFRCPKELVPDITDPNIYSETRIPYHWDIERF